MMSRGLKQRIKKIGIIGFILFLLKGILWLLIPPLITYFSLK